MEVSATSLISGCSGHKTFVIRKQCFSSTFHKATGRLVDVQFDLLPFRKQCGSDVIGVEDEHPPFSVHVCNDLPFFFNEATEMRELNLHLLVDNLSD